MRSSSRWFQIVPVILTVAAQCPVLSLFFWGDDFYHLFKYENDRFLRTALEMFGDHMPVLKNLFLILTFELFGPPSPLYLATMLALHCIAVLLLYRIVHVLTSSPWYASFFASLWGINPILKGVLGWYCTVGNVLTVIIVLFVILDILKTTRPSYLRAASWIALIFAGALTFGTGIAVSGSFAVALFLFLQGDERRARLAGLALLLIPATVGTYLLLNQLNARIGNEHALGAFRVFHLSLVHDVVYLFSHLLAHGIASVLTGPLAVLSGSARVLQPLHAAAVLLFVILGIRFWRRATPKERHVWTALGVMVCSIYGLVALGRVWDMSFRQDPASVVAATARFHYATTALLTAQVALMLRGDDSRFRVAGALLLLAFTVSSTLLTRRTVEHVERHELCRAEYAATIAYIEESVLRQPEGATVYIPNKRLGEIVPFFDHTYYFPHTLAVYIMSYPKDTLHGRRVFFVDDDRTVERLRTFPPSRTTRLLKTEAEARALAAP